MKKICLIIALLITYHANSQVVNILSWDRGEVQKNIVIEQPPEYYYEKVIRINTNIPVGGIAGDFRPVIMIDGYTYTNASVLSLKLAWSTKDIDFSNASVSTSGGLSPQIYIKNVAGKAVIYIRNLGNSDGIVNFTITGLLHANLLENYNNNIQPWYSGWYIDEEVDPEYDLIPEIIEGENGPPASALGTAIIYHNEFSGDTKIGGGLTVYGAAAINTATLGSATITGTADLGTLKVNGDANMGNVYARGTVTSGKGVWIQNNSSIKNPQGAIVSYNGIDGVIDFSTKSSFSIPSPSPTPAGYPYVVGRIRYSENTTAIGVAQGNGFDFFTKNPTKNNPVAIYGEYPQLRIRNDGDVCINTLYRPASVSRVPNAAPYEDIVFAVKGQIVAQKMRVTQLGWADYVFDPSYELRSLQSVEEYIKEHGHLPDVPSAKEVENDGVDIGAIQAMLLRKIEELTLYVIEQGKRNDEQQKLIEEQRKMLLELKGQLKK